VHEVPYDAWGRAFLESAVTGGRIHRAVADIAGDTVEMGPIQAGPGGAATVHVVGHIRAIDVVPRPDALVSYTATLTIDLELAIKASGTHRFTGTVTVPLVLTARTAVDPLALIIDVDRVRGRDIGTKLHTDGLKSKIVQRVGNVDGEVRKHVSRIVNERIESEAAVKARVIEVLAAVDDLWPEN
jgi:hypothetical protein